MKVLTKVWFASHPRFCNTLIGGRGGTDLWKFISYPEQHHINFSPQQQTLILRLMVTLCLRFVRNQDIPYFPRPFNPIPGTRQNL